jgi:hypothetical protein
MPSSFWNMAASGFCMAGAEKSSMIRLRSESSCSSSSGSRSSCDSPRRSFSVGEAAPGSVLCISTRRGRMVPSHSGASGMLSSDEASSRDSCGVAPTGPP